MGSGNKLQRQKKSPWSLGEREEGKMCLGEGAGERPCMLQGATLGPHLEGIYLEVSEVDPNGIVISFQVCLFRVWSLLIGWHQARRLLVIAAGPDVSHGVVCLVLLLFWAWN